MTCALRFTLCLKAYFLMPIPWEIPWDSMALVSQTWAVRSRFCLGLIVSPLGLLQLPLQLGSANDTAVDFPCLRSQRSFFNHDRWQWIDYDWFIYWFLVVDVFDKHWKPWEPNLQAVRIHRSFSRPSPAPSWASEESQKLSNSETALPGGCLVVVVNWLVGWWIRMSLDDWFQARQADPDRGGLAHCLGSSYQAGAKNM